jgi:hypothetical protein
MNEDLQGLLRAVLFEGGEWYRETGAEAFQEVPLRRKDAQASAALLLPETQADVALSATATLGTSRGLLLNELMHAPEAVMTPFFAILASMNDLRDAGVYSSDAGYLTFLIDVTIQLESYLTYGTRSLSLSSNLLTCCVCVPVPGPGEFQP